MKLYTTHRFTTWKRKTSPGDHSSIPALILVICAVVLAASTMHTFAAAEVGGHAESPRTIISLDKDWRFHKGHLPLPGRSPIYGWKYRMEPKGEAAAYASIETMTSEGLDTGGGEWKEGTRFEYEKDVTGEEWIEGGNLRPKGEPLFAWFRVEIPGFAASRPAIEFVQVEGIAHVYANGVKLARNEGRASSFVVDLAPVWKSTGTNTVAMLIESKGYGGFYRNMHLVDLEAPLPSTNQLSPSYDDSDWRRVDVPHDYVVEGPVTDRGADGYNRDYGWYRRTLEVPELKPGSRVWIEFDGVFG